MFFIIELQVYAHFKCSFLIYKENNIIFTENNLFSDYCCAAGFRLT